MGFSGFVHLTVAEVVEETDKAFLFRLRDRRSVWIPRGQVADPENYTKGDTNCSVSITDWIADQKNITGED